MDRRVDSYFISFDLINRLIEVIVFINKKYVFDHYPAYFKANHRLQSQSQTSFLHKYQLLWRNTTNSLIMIISLFKMIRVWMYEWMISQYFSNRSSRWHQIPEIGDRRKK